MNSYHDGNGRHTVIAVESDGVTLVNIKADPITHALYTSDGVTGSDNGPIISRHDDSHVPILMATSNSDGRTPVAIYGNASNQLLVESI